MGKKSKFDDIKNDIYANLPIKSLKPVDEIEKCCGNEECEEDAMRLLCEIAEEAWCCVTDEEAVRLLCEELFEDEWEDDEEFAGDEIEEGWITANWEILGVAEGKGDIEEMLEMPIIELDEEEAWEI